MILNKSKQKLNKYLLMIYQELTSIYFHLLSWILTGIWVVGLVLVMIWIVTLILQAKPLLNCFIVAISIWIDGRCQQYLWMRRSRSCQGLLLHFGAAEQLSSKSLRVIEYIPPKSSGVDSFLLFQGEYRVWHLEVTSVKRFDDKESALAYDPTQ